MAVAVVTTERVKLGDIMEGLKTLETLKFSVGVMHATFWSDCVVYTNSCTNTNELTRAELEIGWNINGPDWVIRQVHTKSSTRSDTKTLTWITSQDTMENKTLERWRRNKIRRCDITLEQLHEYLQNPIMQKLNLPGLCIMIWRASIWNLFPKFKVFFEVPTYSSLFGTW